MQCEYCSKEHDGSFASGRFCQIRCSRAFASKEKRKEINEKVSKKLTKIRKIIHCLECGKETFLYYEKRKYCSKRCAAKGKWKHNQSYREKMIEISKTAIKGKFFENPSSILDLNSRTCVKILRRLGIGCSRCGWKEANCDLHHIHGKKIENANSHSNLAHICPNCHRLFHSHKIAVDEIISLEQQIGDKWKQFYYG